MDIFDEVSAFDSESSLDSDYELNYNEKYFCQEDLIESKLKDTALLFELPYQQEGITLELRASSPDNLSSSTSERSSISSDIGSFSLKKVFILFIFVYIYFSIPDRKASSQAMRKSI